MSETAAIPGDSPGDAERLRATIAARARQSAKRTNRSIALFAFGLGLVMWGLIGWSIWSDRQAAFERGRVNGRNLSAAFAVELTHTIDTINGAMDAILRRRPLGEDGQLNLEEIERWARDVPVLARPTAFLALVGPDGESIYINTGRVGMHVDMSSKEFFSIQRERRDAGLYISVPMHERVLEKDMIHFSKRIETADGRFLGVLVFLVPPVELVALYGRIDLGQRGTLTIIGLDHVIRVRVNAAHPDGALGPGKSVGGGPLPHKLAAGGYGSYFRVSIIDGVERLFNYRRLETYPLIVDVAFDLEDVLAEARGHARTVTAFGVMGVVILVILAVLLALEVHRRMLREIELEIERVQLLSARALIQEDQAQPSRVNKELLAAAERAEAASQAKSRFLAHMSHELRTPLHAIIGFSEIIRESAARIPGSAAIIEHASDIHASGQHLLELINAILDISKVESGTEHLIEETVDLTDIIRGSLVVVTGRALKNGIALRADLAPQLPKIRGDVTKLRQIMINILSNAVKFTDMGGAVTVRAEQPPDGGIMITVRDTGIGMSNDEIEVALQPFGQVDSSLARNFEGTGLGLPLALRLVELHGGTMRLLSTKGQGTVVEIWLPPERVV